MVTGSINIEFIIPDEVLDKAAELGMSEKEAVEQYTLQMEGMLYKEIEMSSEEVLEYTLEALEELCLLFDWLKAPGRDPGAFFFSESFLFRGDLNYFYLIKQ